MKKIVTYISVVWGRAPMPSLFVSKDTDFDYLLYAVAKAPCPQWASGLKNYISRVFVYFIWFFKFPFLIFEYTNKYSNEAKAHGAKSVLYQVYEQFKLAVFKRVSPELYYRYHLFIPKRFSKAEYFLAANVGSSFFDLINRDKETLIEDKLNVEKILISSSLPTIKTFAVVDRKNFISIKGAEYRLLDKNMILKPNDGMLGRDIYFIEYCGDKKYKLCDEIVGEDEVNNFVSELSMSCVYLMQPCLKNHTLLEKFAPKSVSSIRLVTGMWSSGDVEIVYAVLKIPAKGQITDNFAGGGFSAAIDLNSGMVGRAVSKKILSKFVTKHPDTEEQIKGIKIPFWDELKRVGVCAHKAFPGFVFLGWDIAVTNDGPVIIETNGNMAVDILQTPELCPLGLTNFSKIAKDRLMTN